MISRRLAALLVAAPLAASLGACASTTDGSGSAAGRDFASGSAGSSTGSADTGAANGPQLVATMKAATASVTSAKLDYSVSASSLSLTGSGVEKLSNGTPTAFDLTQKLPTGEQEILLVDGKTYIKQPGLSSDPSKPYVLVTSSSSNPIVRQLATSLAQTQSSASVDAATKFMVAAKSVTRTGTTSINGEQATGYHVVVDVSKISDQFPNASVIKQSGLADFPVDVYLDDKGRPVRTVTSLSVQGQTVKAQYTISAYDEPVTVTAPPADQVSTG